MGGPVPLLDAASGGSIHAFAAMTVFALGVVRAGFAQGNLTRQPCIGAGLDLAPAGPVAPVPMAGFAESGKGASLPPKSLEKRREKPRAAPS